jgi:hypothetical protein
MLSTSYTFFSFNLYYNAYYLGSCSLFLLVEPIIINTFNRNAERGDILEAKEKKSRSELEAEGKGEGIVVSLGVPGRLQTFMCFQDVRWVALMS